MSKYNGLEGAVVVKVKAEVQYVNSSAKRVLTFANHTELNNWLCSPSVRGHLRVTQVLIMYDYESDCI